MVSRTATLDPVGTLSVEVSRMCKRVHDLPSCSRCSFIFMDYLLTSCDHQRRLRSHVWLPFIKINARQTTISANIVAWQVVCCKTVFGPIEQNPHIRYINTLPTRSDAWLDRIMSCSLISSIWWRWHTTQLQRTHNLDSSFLTSMKRPGIAAVGSRRSSRKLWRSEAGTSASRCTCRTFELVIVLS